MDVVFLGTGAGLPSKERNVSSIALRMLQENQSIWLFDCGEATQHQILHTSIKPRKIDKIFITHLHGDHIYGLPGMLSSRSFQSGETPVTIYGPRGLKEFVETSLRVSGTVLTYPLFIEEVSEGLLFENEQFEVMAKKLSHGIESFGYRITEKSRTGELQPEKLKAAGIEPGPIYQQIKEKEHVTLADGRTISRSDYTGPVKPGRVITILGDTRYFPNLKNFAKGSDLLIHEATFKGDDEALAFDYFHSTSRQAARIAKAASVNKLVLTHISSRYQGEMQEQLLAEAQEIFPNTALAQDFHQEEIPQK
ncbi:ribonuclease Z [Sediminibacillus dalangtanensis]|uniref:Ribonuclease Z n=1 Tax=Sediminibacillus dalangtanensis TaxID=2729421 RepID=A0ABX7VZ76_9BACI|nr:ribonuclease Z [Sediminibacillus dalangtanensis]QTM99732.1 ribonuclease Z [Sediminibacillus dalangtanensis]